MKSLLISIFMVINFSIYCFNENLDFPEKIIDKGKFKGKIFSQVKQEYLSSLKNKASGQLKDLYDYCYIKNPDALESKFIKNFVTMMLIDSIVGYIKYIQDKDEIKFIYFLFTGQNLAKESPLYHKIKKDDTLWQSQELNKIEEIFKSKISKSLNLFKIFDDFLKIDRDINKGIRK